jgi:hypothetical protein
MRTDTTLECEAMDVLVQAFGIAEAGRFISLVKRDTFDYTEWRRDLWEDKTIDEIYAAAADHYEKNKSK